MIGSRPKAPTPSAAEEAFCQAWMDSRDAANRPAVFTSMIAVHVVSLMIEPFVLGTNLVKVAWGLHSVVLPILFYGLANRHKVATMQRAMATAIHLSVLGSAAMVFYAAEISHTTSDMLIATAVHMGVGMFAPQLFPGSRKELAILTVSSVALSCFAIRNVEGGWVWAYVFASLSFWSTVLSTLARRSLRREAQSEYRFRVQVVPEHIVRHTQGKVFLDMNEIFRPEDKFCICISSDWRNYQELCTNIPTSRLTSALNAYYALCQELIRSSFPLGNYYTDWIADELFVVAYLTDNTNEKEMTEAAVRFSLELLTAKGGFYRNHGIPARIDIGLAAGPASLGLMGPEGHRKATALGEIPGRARRLQGAGKIISRRLGEKDRLILDVECRKRLPTAFNMESFSLESHESIRDLKDREIFHATAEAKYLSLAKGGLGHAA
jgi:class 3 adenylate cyclase